MGVVVGLVTFAVGVIVVFVVLAGFVALVVVVLVVVVFVVVGLGAGGIMISSLRVMMKLSKTQSACNVV
jgi:ABC-type transport system involved in cytochrome bd biosynthesis fused ATPase/permease subunit